MATEQEIRDICGMSATVPSSTVLTRWQTLIMAMIDRFNPSADADVADLIVTNRIGELFWNMKNLGTNQPQHKFNIDPLSDAEREMLDTDDYYGSVPMNGQRSTDYARR